MRFANSCAMSKTINIVTGPEASVSTVGQPGLRWDYNIMIYSSLHFPTRHHVAQPYDLE